MSDAFAVAAVTDTLRAILQSAVGSLVPGTTVTARPPDEVAAEHTDAVLNVFLYRTTIDGTMRNLDPEGTRPGETRRPALPLVLHYLITPYTSADSQDSAAHRILGAAMATLHDHPELRPADLRSAAPFSDLHRQTERVRLTPVGLGTEDISKLWTAFQSQYRTSAAYEARIVLLDSADPGRSPLPVVRSGAQDRGPLATVGAAGRPPTLRAITPAVALPGAQLLVTGTGLDAGTPVLRLTHPRLGGPVECPAQPADGGALRATLPADIGAGLWSATVRLEAADGTRQSSTAVPLGVAPRITNELPMQVARDAAGTAVLRVRCAPPVRTDQTVLLLVGDLPVPAEPFADSSSTLVFRLTKAQPGRYALRLRVDGADSPLLDPTATPPEFDTAAAVVVT
ncbi:DUF4255 domain-containing protein [Kitasatospora sp. NPDC001660]